MARAAALLVIGLAGLALAGCNTTGPNQTAGIATGAAIGEAPGAAAGALIGGAIGRELDQGALKAAREAEFRALEFGRTGTPVPWRKGPVYGEVVPGARYQVNTFSCRDYTHTIVVDGQKQSARGTACRQPNGTWQPVT